jgi:1,4-dihydroxy-2-naphthoate octaprenyltransferase
MMGNIPATSAQTVKALSWQMLFGNYRSKLGADGWQELTREVGAPAFRGMDPDEDCPMEPFNQAVAWIDRRLGQGDGALIEEITIASVERWESMFHNLARQLQGRPQKMMELFCTEVHPYFLNDPGASAIVLSAPDHFILRLDNGLLEAFKTGLIRGFCDIVGADAEIEKVGEEYHVRWSVREATPVPSRWALFVNATRLPFLTASVIPVLVATAIAWRDGPLDLLNFALTFLGAALFHLAANVTNDYFDHRSGADAANLTPTPFSGGSRLIQRGLFSPHQTRNLALVCYGLGISIGLLLVMRVGWELAVFGAAGFLVGLLYTAPPFRLVHRGLGELLVGFGFGPVVLLGAYWVQTQHLTVEALSASLPIGMLVAAILYVNEIPDRPWDARAGKNTLLVRMNKTWAIRGYALLLGATYASLLAGVIAGWLAPATLLALLTLPLALSAYRTIRKHFGFPYRLIPANATTIFVHLLTGMLLFWAYIGTGLVERL